MRTYTTHWITLHDDGVIIPSTKHIVAVLEYDNTSPLKILALVEEVNE